MVIDSEKANRKDNLKHAEVNLVSILIPNLTIIRKRMRMTLFEKAQTTIKRDEKSVVKNCMPTIWFRKPLLHTLKNSWFSTFLTRPWNRKESNSDDRFISSTV